MKMKLVAITSLAISFLFCQYATATSNTELMIHTNFYVGAYQGYGVVSNMLNNDGQSAIGRLTFGYEAYHYVWKDRNGGINLELGLQNGKTMRHNPPKDDPTFDVDLPIQTTLNPVLDLLLALKLQFVPGCGYFAFLKGGMAYRQLQFLDGDFVSSINQINPELQAGLGYQLTTAARVVAYYQGIYTNGSVEYTGYPDGYVSVSNIPTQQAGFLGLEFTI